MTVAVVGAGLAGLRTCEALRRHGYGGRIVLVGAEEHPPYSRPPLSKEVLRGDAEPAAARLRSVDEIAALGVEHRCGVTAVALDVDGRRVALDDGSHLDAEQVVIATGARPRPLPGTRAGDTHLLRTVEDCVRLRDSLATAARVVVVGAGFIGLEVAASARARGCAVTVVDVLPAPLARVLPASAGAAVGRLHADHGVEVRCGVGVSGLEVGGGGTVRAVRLADGTTLGADAVVVGIGVVPATGWLSDSGLDVTDGVGCDATLRAAPGIWAVGDVARWRLPDGTSTRVEHWTNAAEQAQAVARAITDGERRPFTPVPYFWSDQYDAKLQSLGFVTADDELDVAVGAFDAPRWVALCHRGDRLTGVVGMRSPARVMKLRPLLAAGASYGEARAAIDG